MSSFIDAIARAVEICGVAIIVIGTALAMVYAVRELARGVPGMHVYRGLRAGIGRSILLGLELLVAADIIETILVRPTLAAAGALAVVVLIRTFLSLSLETEIEGWPPWRRSDASPA